MSLWAIVPVKPLRRGKSRLAKVLTPDECTALNEELLANTINTLMSVPEIAHVLVVSRDQAALSLARSLGARTVQENGAPQINVALSRATVIAKTYATQSVLVLPADLPLITPEDILVMLSKAVDPPVVVVVPDRNKNGTNALILSPPDLIEYQYGNNSFKKHCELALEAGARLEICELSSLILDLDEPEDLALLEKKLNIELK
ncbi:MAG: 2-phospho-L-lactate guanylyltransferase [Chloroflexota bacterium]